MLGDENDWKKHYDYLSKFFHDERYIKINKPADDTLYQSLILSKEFFAILILSNSYNISVNKESISLESANK